MKTFQTNFLNLHNISNLISKGTVEIKDQVAGLEAASKIFNCIDLKRVAIFGWSYGGYMALMGIAQRPDVFKVCKRNSYFFLRR
jgi:dipeptidyl aminopeptidase/acylaminoacyl peptidase